MPACTITLWFLVLFYIHLLKSQSSHKTISKQKITRTVFMRMSTITFILLCLSIWGIIKYCSDDLQKAAKEQPPILKRHPLFRKQHDLSHYAVSMLSLFTFIHMRVNYLNWIMYCSSIQYSWKGFQCQPWDNPLWHHTSSVPRLVYAQNVYRHFTATKLISI